MAIYLGWTALVLANMPFSVTINDPYEAARCLEKRLERYQPETRGTS